MGPRPQQIRDRGPGLQDKCQKGPRAIRQRITDERDRPLSA